MPADASRFGGKRKDGPRSGSTALVSRDPRLESGIPLGLAYLMGGIGLALLPGVRAASFLGSALFGAARETFSGPLPQLHLTAPLAAKVVIDEAARAFMVGMARVPSRSQRSRIRHEVSSALELYEDRGWLEHPERFHREPHSLSRPRMTLRRAAGIDFEHLEFQSGYQPREGEPGRDRWLGMRANRTAHAWVLRHREGIRPWLVCIPGFRMGNPTIDLPGLRAAHHHYDLGFNVLIPVLPLHGPRSMGRRSGDGFITADALNTIHAEAQAMWDIRRLLSWIRAEGEAGIGVFGVSLGGYNTALLASLEHDLSCAIAGIPASCFPSLLEEHAPRFLLRIGERLGLAWEDMRRIMRVVSPLAMHPKIPVERRYVFGGLADRLVPPEHVYGLWDHWERPRIAWYQGSHLSFHFEPEVRILMFEAFSQSGMLASSAPMRDRFVA